MTRLEVEIGAVVVRGLPETYGTSLGALVEERLGALARGEQPGMRHGEIDGEEPLADLVAQQVWDEVRPSTSGLWGERR